MKAQVLDCRRLLLGSVSEKGLVVCRKVNKQQPNFLHINDSLYD